jgi:hypothetical protein
MPEGTTQYYLGENLIKYVALGDRLVASNPFTFADVDPDAQTFINVTGISGSNATAINNLVVSLKNENLWNNLFAIYPMVGGTATTHKYNLKDPQDTNGAYRLNFQGGWTHNSSGAKPDGVSGTYADTFLIPNGLLTSTASSISYFSFTNNAAADDIEIGCNDGAATTKESLLALRFSDGNQYAFLQQGGTNGGMPGTSAGFLVADGEDILGGKYIRGFRNGSQVIGPLLITPQGFSARSFYLAAQNNGTTSYRNSSRGCSFASIGGALTGKLGTFSTIVNTYQSELGRTTY